MKVILGLGKIKKISHSVITIGIFDGVHLGHQLILEKVKIFARRIKGKSVVITFYPHPAGEESLLSLKHRLKLISQFGIDICVVINFTKEFSRICASDFVKDILVKKFSPTAIFIGENFTFGKDARGDVKLLKELAVKYGFKLYIIPVLRQDNKIISSTYIRSLIKRGDIGLAQKLLGHPVSLLGTVISGYGWARTWNIPTANINPHHEVLPKGGVYAVEVNLNKRIFDGVCYIGRPSLVKDKKNQRIEVHIFNLKKKIYGKDLEILFIKRLRNSRSFSSQELLIRQIKKDIKKAKKVLSKQRPF
ncbi:MAG: bifunctional riboflavin kinase/FAD synthetase [Candidatus Omnitrophica bacterium]|nr:bifunctional riboflavin kinase/FAD synthetase [Candidatus Omnitrophota bacterium]